MIYCMSWKLHNCSCNFFFEHCYRWMDIHFFGSEPKTPSNDIWQASFWWKNNSNVRYNMSPHLGWEINKQIQFHTEPPLRIEPLHAATASPPPPSASRSDPYSRRRRSRWRQASPQPASSSLRDRSWEAVGCESDICYDQLWKKNRVN